MEASKVLLRIKRERNVVNICHFVYWANTVPELYLSKDEHYVFAYIDDSMNRISLFTLSTYRIYHSLISLCYFFVERLTFCIHFSLELT